MLKGKDRPKVRAIGPVNGGWDCDDVDVGAGAIRCIGGQFERARPKRVGFDLVRPVVPVAQFRDAALVDIDAGRVEVARERNRKRKPHIAKADNDDTRISSHEPDYSQSNRFGHTSTETDE